MQCNYNNKLTWRHNLGAGPIMTFKSLQLRAKAGCSTLVGGVARADENMKMQKTY